MSSIIKALQKITHNKLEEKGFLYEGKRGSACWCYYKDVDGGKQFIKFYKSQHQANSIRLELQTTLSRELVLTNGLGQGQFPEWFTYDDSESLQESIKQLTDISINYGIPRLDVMSTPDLEPTIEHYNLLMINPTDAAEQFIKQNKLDKNDGLLKMLESFIIDQRSKFEGQPDWSYIIQASAVYGEYIRQTLGGEWEIDKDTLRPQIMGIGGKPSLAVLPLHRVARFWGKPDYSKYSLVESYQRIVTLAKA